MPWGITKETTLPSLKNKSLEYREIFAEVANAALNKGLTKEEAITSGIGAAEANERRKAKEIKKQQLENKTKASHIPEHLRLIIEAKELKKKLQLEQEESEQLAFKEQVLKYVDDIPTIDIKDMYFDKDGRLVIRLTDGKIVRTSNSVPEEVINKYISVSMQPQQKSLEPMTILNSLGDPEIVFYSDGEIVTTVVNTED